MLRNIQSHHFKRMIHPCSNLGQGFLPGLLALCPLTLPALNSSPPFTPEKRLTAIQRRILGKYARSGFCYLFLNVNKLYTRHELGLFSHTQFKTTERIIKLKIYFEYRQLFQIFEWAKWDSNWNSDKCLIGIHTKNCKCNTLGP